MVGIVVISHGSLASGLNSAVTLLAGTPASFSVVELHPGDEPSEFKDRVKSAISATNSGDGVLALVDIYGGTPSNTVAQLLEQNDIEAIAGVNLAMVIQAVFAREQEGVNLKVLKEMVVQAGNEALTDIRQKVFEISQTSDDEEDF